MLLCNDYPQISPPRRSKRVQSSESEEEAKDAKRAAIARKEGLVEERRIAARVVDIHRLAALVQTKTGLRLVRVLLGLTLT